MPPRPARLTPHELARTWPDAPADDPVAEVARQFVVNLLAVMGGRSLREIERLTGVERTTLADFLAGRNWPDLATLARLELGLDAELWPRRGGETEGATKDAGIRRP